MFRSRKGKVVTISKPSVNASPRPKDNPVTVQIVKTNTGGTASKPEIVSVKVSQAYQISQPSPLHNPMPSICIESDVEEEQGSSHKDSQGASVSV